MRLWQAVWELSGRLIIWGESEQTYRDLSGKKPNSDGKSKTEHPFACSIKSLVDDLDGLEFDADAEGYAKLWLPTQDGLPVASTKLLEVCDQTYPNDCTLSCWKVPCLVLDPLASMAFLSSRAESPPEKLHFQDSFLVWQESTKYLLDLLAHGRFIPLLSRQGGNYLARWQTVVNQELDTKRLTTLVRALPAAAKTPVELEIDPEDDLGTKTIIDDSQTPNLLNSTVILESFLSHCGDALIRMFLKSRELSTEYMRSRATHGAVTGWLQALTNAEPEIGSSAHELLKLEEKIKLWSSKLLAGGVAGRFQTCFSVIAPEEVPSRFENAQWQIEIVLQSPGEPQTFLKAEDFWAGKLGFLGKTDLNREEIEEILLKELGLARTAFPELDMALEGSSPSMIELPTNEAWNFLKDTSPALEKLGFRVNTPEWWGSSNGQLGLHLSVESPDSNKGSVVDMLGMSQLVDFSWSLSLGDEKISAEEFKKLIDQKSNLVFIGNQWIDIDPKKLESTFKFLESQEGVSKMKLIDALRFGFGVAQGDDTIPITGFSSTGWVGNLLNSDSSSIVLDRKIKNFNGDLRPYQKHGLSWLYFLTQVGVGGCLADDMGLGKTVQFLALLQLEREIVVEEKEKGSISDEFRVLPTLLIVPMSILENWEREAAKFAPEIKVYLHHGPTRQTGPAFSRAISGYDLIVTTYSLAHRDEDALAQAQWGRICLDEAQNIKNLATKQSKAVRKLAEDQLLQNRPNSMPVHRVALTGTPLENRLDELWSIFDFLNPGFLGKLSEFRSRFTLPIERHRDQASSEALSKLVKPFLLRRLKTQPDIISDLPEKIEMEVYTPLTTEQASLYQKVVDQMIPEVSKLDGIHRKGLVLSSLTRLKQICNHPSLYLKDGGETSARSGKLNRLEELLEVILAEGDKTLIFTQYAQMGEILKKHLTSRFNEEVIFLHGSLSKKNRGLLIDKFQTTEGPKIFILSLKAGGFGLNLTEASQVIHYDQWWNPAVEDQATDRAFRIGQKKNVQVRKFICKGTLEEKISSLLSSKKELADNIVGTARSTITEMSVNELRELLQLSTGTPEKSDIKPGSEIEIELR